MLVNPIPDQYLNLSRHELTGPARVDLLDAWRREMVSVLAATQLRLSQLNQGWKFMSCSQCQELCQQASWLLIGCTRVNNQSEARIAS